MEIVVKDFSGTTRPRILKFDTNIRYDRLYCVLKNQPHMAYQSLYYAPNYEKVGSILVSACPSVRACVRPFKIKFKLGF